MGGLIVCGGIWLVFVIVQLFVMAMGEVQASSHFCWKQWVDGE